MNELKKYKSGDIVPEHLYTLDFSEGMTINDYPDLKVTFMSSCEEIITDGKSNLIFDGFYGILVSRHGPTGFRLECTTSVIERKEAAVDWASKAAWMQSDYVTTVAGSQDGTWCPDSIITKDFKG